MFKAAAQRLAKTFFCHRRPAAKRLLVAAFFLFTLIAFCPETDAARLGYRLVPGQRLRYRLLTEQTINLDYAGRVVGAARLRTAYEVVFTVLGEEGRKHWVLSGEMVLVETAFLLEGQPVSLESGGKREAVSLNVRPGGAVISDNPATGENLAAGFFPPLPARSVPKDFSWSGGDRNNPVRYVFAGEDSLAGPAALRITVSGAQNGELFFSRGVLSRGLVQGGALRNAETTHPEAVAATAWRWQFNLVENILPPGHAPPESAAAE